MTQNSFWQQDATYTLREIALFNWGGFNGHHRAQIDPDGTAVVGPTGSGKTTLIDALMTLICSAPKYNLASTGGHESDRDLVSYVRGVSGPGDGSERQTHISRQGKTVTGLAITLENGECMVRLGAVLWFDDTSSSTTDLKRLWFFSTDQNQTLEQWLSAQHEGGMAALRQIERNNTSIWTYTSKKDYLARVRDYFEVRENAFTLLNRAAGLKQLNSIDDIFRELVLDDTSAFERAKEVADSFDDLSAIHNELEVANRQQRSLEPVKTAWGKYTAHQQLYEEKNQLKSLLPVWFGELSFKLWHIQCEQLQTQLAETEQSKTNAEKLQRAQIELRDTLKEAYLKLGGGDIQTLEELIKEKRGNLTQKENNALQYGLIAKQLNLLESVDEKSFTENKSKLDELQRMLQPKVEQAKEHSFGIGVTYKQFAEQALALEKDVQETQLRPGSNIPPIYHHFRTQLALALKLDEQQLPFVAELVQVKESEQIWRGAIERAIGANRLRLLVPPKMADDALRWINQRDNKLHVRLLEVREPESPPRFFDDGFAKKLDYKPHPYREAVKALIADIDRHCVNSVETLRLTQHAMTREGTMSGKTRFYDKQDQKGLHDDWQTGFNNQDRLAALLSDLNSRKQLCEGAAGQLVKAREEEQKLVVQQKLMDVFGQLTFDEIDVVEARRQLNIQLDKLTLMTAPDSELTLAKQQSEQAEADLKDLTAQFERLKEQHFKALHGLEFAVAQKTKAYQRCEPGLSEAQRQLAGRLLEHLCVIQLQELDSSERQTMANIEQELKILSSKEIELSNTLVRLMASAKKEDQGALAEVGTELRDVPSYLARLTVLTEEALPEKRQRFKIYLNRSSDEGVTQLLTAIENEVGMIEERLEDVNNTLRRTDFQPERYLQLVASKVVHESLRSLQRAQKRLASARFVDDEGESQYRALQNIVEQLREACERQRTLAAKALLDPRFRLEFKISVVDRNTGKIIETRRGSQGGSGGEKEIIASYVLTASLSYALCPDGSSRPLFGSIVLDEAFSRSSPAVAGRIIAALKEFGLHALFITPNKEMRLLRHHTRSAIIVHRRELSSQLVTLSWQELDQHKAIRIGELDEITN